MKWVKNQNDTQLPFLFLFRTILVENNQLYNIRVEVYFSSLKLDLEAHYYSWLKNFPWQGRPTNASTSLLAFSWHWLSMLEWRNFWSNKKAMHSIKRKLVIHWSQLQNLSENNQLYNKSGKLSLSKGSLKEMTKLLLKTIRFNYMTH